MAVVVGLVCNVGFLLAALYFPQLFLRGSECSGHQCNVYGLMFGMMYLVLLPAAFLGGCGMVMWLLTPALGQAKRSAEKWKVLGLGVLCVTLFMLMVMGFRYDSPPLLAATVAGVALGPSIVAAFIVAWSRSEASRDAERERVMFRKALLASAAGSFIVVVYTVAPLNDEAPEIGQAKDVFETFAFPEAEHVRTETTQGLTSVHFTLVSSSRDLQVVAPEGAELSYREFNHAWYDVPKEDARGGSCDVEVDRDESVAPPSGGYGFDVRVSC